MSSLSVTPDAVTSAAGQLDAIGSALSEANAAAAGPTTGVAAMGADEVSAALQSVFAAAAQGYQRISAQAETFHSQFVSLLNGGAAAYLNTEIANAQQTGAAAVPAVRVTGGAATTPINIFNLPGLFTFSETFPLTGGAFADITLFGTTIYNGRINDQLAQFFLRL